jgi:hypothetical protein
LSNATERCHKWLGVVDYQQLVMRQQNLRRRDPLVKKAKLNSRYKVMSVQAYDLAKAGSAMTIKVQERGKLLVDQI